MPEDLIYLGRQPILDWKSELIGHEILFRSSRVNMATICNPYSASAQVISKVLVDFGITAVLGSHKGYFNVNYEFLLSDKIELLPPDRAVIELLESVSIDETVLRRCRDLKAQGFQIALDDAVFAPSMERLYELADIIKIDIRATEPSKLVRFVQLLRQRPILLLAEKVESREEFLRCRDLGFKLFQGYYFAMPEVMTKGSMPPAKLAVLQLLRQVLADADIDELEDSFHRNPPLVYRLLRLVNSVMVGARYRIESVRHALSVLGQNQLKRWILLAVFADREGSPLANPLFEMAALRGKLMESLVQRLATVRDQGELAPRAFMTGILSLLHLPLKVPLDTICRELCLNDQVQLALLDRQGPLGGLLTLAEALEDNDTPALAELTDKLAIGREDLLAAQMESFRWLNAFVQADDTNPRAENG